MREIKFRAWEYGHEQTTGIGWASSPMVWKMNYEPKIWGSETVTEGDRVNLNEALNNGGTADYDIEHKSVFMQYTGLKDKNGVEIYEGDVVAIQMYQVEDYVWEKGVVKWHQPSSAFKWFSLEEDPSDGHNYWLSQADEKGREVVGNIYENPDMLK